MPARTQATQAVARRRGSGWSGAGRASRQPLSKRFVEPVAGTVEAVLPLAAIHFLEPGEEPRLQPISAGERIARLQDDHYTAELFERARGLSRADRFAQLAAIAARVSMTRFARPFDPARFREGRDFIADIIREGGAT
jgi:hypothetical protein